MPMIVELVVVELVGVEIVEVVGGAGHVAPPHAPQQLG